MDNYLIKNKKKINISTDSLNFIGDDHKRFKTVSNKIDNKLDDVEDHSRIIHLKPQNINDPYNLPDTVNKFKILDINESDFNNLVMGFDEPSLRFRGTQKIKNAYLYGEPSEKELMVSNYQTEAETNNDLNQKLLQVETGESIEDIKDAHNLVDSVYDKGLKDILDQINKDKDETIEKINKKDPTEKRTLEQVDTEFNKELKEKKDKFKKEKVNEKANIKPIVEAIKTNRKEKESAIKIQNLVKKYKGKSPRKLPQKVLDEIFKGVDDEPAEETEEERKERLDKVKQAVYDKKQNDINIINDKMRSETETYDKFNELIDEIIKLGDKAKLDTDDPLRKEINKLLKKYNKDIGAAKKIEAVLKRLNTIRPEVNAIHEKRVTESEKYKLNIEKDKNTRIGPRKSARIHQLTPINDSGVSDETKVSV